MPGSPARSTVVARSTWARFHASASRRRSVSRRRERQLAGLAAQRRGQRRGGAATAAVHGTSNTMTGSGSPFSSISPMSTKLSSVRPRARPRTRSSQRIWPPSAESHRRAAVTTGVPWQSPSSQDTSPALIPTRTSMRRSSRLWRFARSMRTLDLVRRVHGLGRRPERGEDAVAEALHHRSAVLGDRGAEHLVVAPAEEVGLDVAESGPHLGAPDDVGVQDRCSPRSGLDHGATLRGAGARLPRPNFGNLRGVAPDGRMGKVGRVVDRPPRGRLVDQEWKCLDGNEAAARVAYALSEVIALYPITPASPMGEHCDDWAAAGRGQPLGHRSRRRRDAVGGGCGRRPARRTAEGCARDDVHRVAGPAADGPQHVQDRGRADAGGHPRRRAHGRHARVVDLRRPQRRDARPAATGWAMLSAGSVQEAHDFALVAHAATLRSRVPFLHFFDGFRTSHEIDKIALLTDADIAALIREEDVVAFRVARHDARRARRAGDGAEPRRLLPGTRGGQPVPRRGTRRRRRGVRRARRADRTALRSRRLPRRDRRRPRGRRDGLGRRCVGGDRRRHARPRANASGWCASGSSSPSRAEALVAALPPSVRAVAVLDRTKEPGAVGEPLYLSVLAAIDEAMDGDDAAVRAAAARDRAVATACRPRRSRPRC